MNVLTYIIIRDFAREVNAAIRRRRHPGHAVKPVDDVKLPRLI